ncbi:MAG: hypothetical protein A3D74_05500 [Candidatus Levybacteria bacterium RIFCSPHIGHO2_02_FULL_37_13]|nr:MAG: hypothetical protein A3D74_05500 [Candidatus Levybacteria bacterium RIFCSPHIGHO2_02_FULL_37_13]OGH29267.1 MAG: hypothetical protein A3E40_03390 [Candidatus Levybacteria bacterium RIFCSPHIGHO2_12_FULL_37_9]OGH40399.1 MAG: hypothetical protein A3B41_02725 [Candidatus Levybacteria bacterium RIFCSPLOWO2_01_FULL_37_26]
MENSNQTSQAQEINSQMPPINNNSSKSKVIPIILGIATVAVIAIGAYVLGTKQPQPVVQNSVQTIPIPTPTPITSISEDTTFVAYRSLVKDGFGYEVKGIPYNWSILNENENPGVDNLYTRIFCSSYNYDACKKGTFIRVKYFESTKINQDIKDKIDSLKKSGFTESIIQPKDKVSLVNVNKTDFYTYVVAPKGFFEIYGKDIQEDHRGMAYGYFVSTFKLIN